MTSRYKHDDHLVSYYRKIREGYLAWQLCLTFGSFFSCQCINNKIDYPDTLVQQLYLKPDAGGWPELSRHGGR
jgi:hypothetical protein